VEENWDNLVLTGIDSRKIVLTKWLAVISCVWRDYLWLACLKFGLVWGLVKFFSNITPDVCYANLGGGLCYFSRNSDFLRSAYEYAIFALFTFVSLLALFSMMEAGLLTALGICFGSMNRRHRIVGLGCAAIFRGILAFTAVVIWVMMGKHSDGLFKQMIAGDPFAAWRWNMTGWERLDILGSIQIVLSPLADNGTILLTDLMRTTETWSRAAQSLVKGGISLALFGCLIWLSLRVAEMFAVRQRALGPQEPELHAQELAT
jgi:hypothetical protein